MLQDNKVVNSLNVKSEFKAEATEKETGFFFSQNRLLIYFLKIAVILSPLIYLLLWNVIIRSGFQPIWQQILQMLSASSGANWANVHVAAQPEAIVWRMGVIPVYWSKVGNLSPYHNVFSLFYVAYLSISVFKTGRIRSLKLQSLRSTLSYENMKRFWVVFGLIAFLTTSFSTIPFFSDLFFLTYYFVYIASIALAPLSLYLYWKKRKERTQNFSEI